MSSDGCFLYSVGQDRSIRVWEKGDDLVFVEEERERALEAQVDLAAENERPMITNGVDFSGVNGENNELITTKNLESVKGGELLMETLDTIKMEMDDIFEFEVSIGKMSNKVKNRNANPIMLGLSPHQYMLRSLRMIKAPDLQQALILLPFNYVTQLISVLVEMANRGLDVELCSRCAVFLINSHNPQIVHSQSLLTEMMSLQSIISHSIGAYYKLIGSNIAGLRFANNIILDRRDEGIIDNLVDDKSGREQMTVFDTSLFKKKRQRN